MNRRANVRINFSWGRKIIVKIVCFVKKIPFWSFFFCPLKSYLTILGWKDRYWSWSWLFLSTDGRLESSCGKRLPLGVLLTLASPQSSFWTILVTAREWTCQPSALWKFTLSWEIAGFMNLNKDPILQPWRKDLLRYWRSTRQRYVLIYRWTYLVPGGGGGRGDTQPSFIRWGSASRPAPYHLFSYTIFGRKGTPFVYFLLTDGTHSIYLVYNSVSLLTAVSFLFFNEC